ncbi:hypothetical protein ACFV7Q_12250 [Streptomyces sp. NPDC059851]|uniref:hypothetical protein n=1 Tax=Streptomyces sp. NPDC059851 TaxID=3346971 RepID=UPI00364D25D8
MGESVPKERARREGHPDRKYIAMIYGTRVKWDSSPAGAWPEAIADVEPVELRPVLHEAAADL